LKYLVIGAGGTGGCIGGYMSRAGKDVTLIARGSHLEAIKNNGLRFDTPEGEWVQTVKACQIEEYERKLDEKSDEKPENKPGEKPDEKCIEKPDVIFVCVKGYSIEDIVPFIAEVSGEDTVVIPILNIYGTGRKLQEKLGDFDFKGLVTDGCIYVASQIKEPGTILMNGMIFRVVYGMRKDTPEEVKEKYMPILKMIEKDLSDCAITPILSDNIERDALQKFSFVSPMAAAGAYYDLPAEPFQVEGEYRELFKNLIGEIKALSIAMDAALPDNIIDINLKILDDLVPSATASMHRDIKAGKQSEFDGLVSEVVRLGKHYGVPTPCYDKLDFVP